MRKHHRYDGIAKRHAFLSTRIVFLLISNPFPNQGFRAFRGTERRPRRESRRWGDRLAVGRPNKRPFIAIELPAIGDASLAVSCIPTPFSPRAKKIRAAGLLGAGVRLEPRGSVEVKGKGRMPMFFVSENA